jgi:hypothetical protein
MNGILKQLAIALLSLGTMSAMAQVSALIESTGAGTVRVSWNSESNQQYQLQYSSTLTSNSWVNLNQPIQGNGSNTTVADPILTQGQRFYRIRRLQPLFPRGIEVRGRFDLNGNNFQADSFDSGTNTASTFGQYDAAKASDHCDIAAYLGITNTVNVGGISVFGKIATGPDASVSLDPTSSVGDKAWHTAANVGIEPGFLTNNLPLPSNPAVALPNAFAPFVPISNITLGGVLYRYVLTDGDWVLDTLTINAAQKVLIVGNARLYVRGNFSVSDQAVVQIATGARLAIYVSGSIAIAGNGFINPHDASHCIIYGFPTCTHVSIGGNSPYIGCLYALQADFTPYSVGSNTADFQGALKVNTLALNGHFNFHYDENLQRNGPVQ